MKNIIIAIGLVFLGIFTVIFALLRFILGVVVGTAVGFIAPWVSLVAFFTFIGGIIVMFCDIERPYEIGFSLIAGACVMYVGVALAHGLVALLIPQEKTDVRNHA